MKASMVTETVIALVHRKLGYQYDSYKFSLGTLANDQHFSRQLELTAFPLLDLEIR